LEKDYYKIIGVSRDASPDEIKKTYRQQALKYHPDKNNGDKESEETFKVISEAYDVLSNPQKRANYDRGGSQRNSRRSNPSWAGAAFNNMDSIFDNLQSRSSRVNLNPDIRISYRIKLSDVILGKEVKIAFDRKFACTECKGFGEKVDLDVTCAACNGRGYISPLQNQNMVFKLTCPKCSGTGKGSTVCPKCNGSAYSPEKCNMVISVPAGLSPMSKLKVSEKGNEIYFKDRRVVGDVYVTVDFPNNEAGVSLRGGNLYMNVNIPLNNVLQEDEVDINVLGCNSIKLKLDSKNQSGHVYSLKEGDFPGFYFVKVLFDLPMNNIDEEQKKKLVNILREIYGESSKEFRPLPS
jgi:molecular chaperone DnaJ